MTEAMNEPATEDHVRDALKLVIDPEIGMNVVDLGLVYGIRVEQGAVRVEMTMTSPACPLGEMLTAEAESAIRREIGGVQSVSIDLVWSPPWQPAMMSADARRELGWG